MEEDTFKVNIRPGINIIRLFKNLNYNFTMAFGEFVDNSTQSFFNHILELEQIDQRKVTVKISVNPDRITISDDAFGMDETEFIRAITPASITPDTTGRNQFGIGLKQAACWLGNEWSVKTTKYGSNIEYSTTIDVDELVNNNIEDVNVRKVQTSKESHYTIITIKKLIREPKGKFLKSLKEDLSDKYVLDLIENKLQLIVKEEELTATLPSAYVQVLPDGSEKEWKQQISFDVDSSIGKLNVSGFIQVLEKGNTYGAGLVLLRNRRAIETKYRPKELFGASTTAVYQRVYGMLHLEGWPVSESKDCFDWAFDNLGVKFIEKLNPLMAEIKRVANTRAVRKEPKNPIPTPTNGPLTPPTPEPGPDYPPIPTPHEVEKPTVKEGSATYGETICEYRMEVSTEPSLNSLIEHTLTKDHKHKIRINLGSPALAEYKDDENCLKLIEKFAIALVLSEEVSNCTSENGLIEPTTIRELINEIMSGQTL